MIAVAEEVFATLGYQASSMDEIAERVGVSKPMLYEYFGSKEGLLVACIRAARAELLAVTTASVRGAAGAEEAMRRGLAAFFEFTDELDPVTNDMTIAILRDEEGHRRLFDGFLREYEAEGLA